MFNNDMIQIQKLHASFIYYDFHHTFSICRKKKKHRMEKSVMPFILLYFFRKNLSRRVRKKCDRTLGKEEQKILIDDDESGDSAVSIYSEWHDKDPEKVETRKMFSGKNKMIKHPFLCREMEELLLRKVLFSGFLLNL